MSNRLQYETSPYLLQHKENPVDWYPWCKEAFERAKAEDKPIFLSIGYSTCHWCHVFAHESFEDAEIAGLLNRFFIAIKVDKEERPDIDNVYMAVCQAFTGSGGWPTSIFMTAEQKPFFAGTYFPKTARGGMIGFRELLLAIHEKWTHHRAALLRQSDEITGCLRPAQSTPEPAGLGLARAAVETYMRTYDAQYGGFGRAPKFPSAHQLLFLFSYAARDQKEAYLHMAEHSLMQMYRGGLFDHIGFGFCRYSTDRQFLVPHFEKMLYDNALLIRACCKAYSITKKALYLEIAEKTAAYILREMTSPAGGFYSAQDADSAGGEGLYYLFTPGEIIEVLGRADGERFNRHFDISETGNFEGRNIPNLLKSDPTDESFEPFLLPLLHYRKKRYTLHLDDKILTFWNALMIAAMGGLYLVSGKKIYLEAAKRADTFVQKNLYENDTLFVSFRQEKRGVPGFLDDYAGMIFALLTLYQATLESAYLERASRLCDKAVTEFEDPAGGYFFYSQTGEALILRPKETYDGAIPSGNSIMAYNLVRLSLLTGNEKYRTLAERQLNFLAAEAAHDPAGYAMFLTALLEYQDPPLKVTVVPDENTDCSRLPFSLPADAAVILLRKHSKEYPLHNGQTTYYGCRNHSCLPPVNDPGALFH